MKKKVLGFLLSACMVLSLCSCGGTATTQTSDASKENAEEAAESEESTSDEAGEAEEAAPVIEGMVNTIPAVGDSLCGFTVVKEEPFETYGGTLVTLTHEKSGGTVVWLANDDTNRSFVIGFRTHYDVDTGVPHVFEHAACSGSEKYQDSEMVFAMMRQIYETYVNAGTFQDWTDFKVASLSDEQLLPMADFMLSGVFEPLVLTDKHAMMREAYRYELDDADSDIKLTGTVYSEMQGAYYSEAKDYAMLQQLYPGSWHAVCTGGKPGVIEEMTQQDLIDFHETYYVPSNAISMLYGDLNLSDFLELIGSYYDAYEPTDVSTDDPNYEPFTGYSRVDCDIPASSGEEQDTTLVYAMPVRGYSETDTYMLTSLIGDAVNNDSSAFNNLMLTRFPTGMVSVSITNGGETAEPMLVFQMDNAGETVPEDFVAAVKEGLAADLEEGIKSEVLTSSLKNAVKQALTAREQSNVGITVSQDLLLSAFAKYGDASVCVENLDELLNHGEEWLESGLLEEVMENSVNPEDSRLIVLTTKPGMLDEINAASAQKLKDKKAAMTDEEIQALVDETAEFKAWQKEQSESSQINEIKVLTVSDLPDEIKEFTAKDTTENGIRYVTSDTGDDRLVTLTLYFDASGIPADDLTRYAALSTDLLGTLSTTEHSRDEVSLLKSKYGISFAADVLVNANDLDSYRPVFTATVDCMQEDLSDAIGAVWEILTETQFTENDIIRHTLTASSKSNQNVFGTAAPMYLPYFYSQAALSASGRYNLELQFTPYLKYNASVGKMDDAALEAEEDAWQDILSGLLNKTNLAVSVVSGQESIDETLNALGAYTDTLTEAEITPVDYSTLTPISTSMAFTVSGSANYNVKAIRLDEAGIEYSGSLEAVSALMADKVLMEVMRHQNGVYSPISEFDNRSSYMIMAYRDPSIAVTYDEVIPTLGDELRNMNITQEDLDSYIISSYSKLAMPLGPISGAKTAVSDVLTDSDTFADKLADMASLRSLTPDDLDDVAVLYDALNEKGVTYTSGSSAAVEAEKDRFEKIETWFASSETAE